MTDIRACKKDLEYCVGPLIYMPALRRDIKEKLIKTKSTGLSCAAICLEDTIRDDKLTDAENNLITVITDSYNCISLGEYSSEDFPNIFIRVRDPKQMKLLAKGCGESFKMISGFIFPKINELNISSYIEEMFNLDDNLLMMPIIENPSLLNPRKRYAALQVIYDILYACKDNVLNVRVGGNDFSNAVSICTDVFHTIYDIAPVASLLSDISAFFTSDFTVSAPVWNYFDGENWLDGMKKEMDKDRYYGFIGKTVIHPNQIPVVLEYMKIPQTEYDAAKLILNSDDEIQAFNCGGRMYENKVHTKWAERTVKLAEVYGIRTDEEII